MLVDVRLLYGFNYFNQHLQQEIQTSFSFQTKKYLCIGFYQYH